jgi:hypothetical protein
MRDDDEEDDEVVCEAPGLGAGDGEGVDVDDAYINIRLAPITTKMTIEIRKRPKLAIIVFYIYLSLYIK